MTCAAAAGVDRSRLIRAALPAQPAQVSEWDDSLEVTEELQQTLESAAALQETAL